MRRSAAKLNSNRRGAQLVAMNRVQFQSGLSLPEFLERFGDERACERALEKAR